MSKYTVKSARLSGHELGDEVTDTALEGVNVEALIAGGHITRNPTTPPKKEKS
mgnify:CR=1 FL=1|tara:strand:- start:174 stop:332 length:159 start_codon:yes stop_codon:yes gene_type:complete